MRYVLLTLLSLTISVSLAFSQRTYTLKNITNYTVTLDFRPETGTVWENFTSKLDLFAGGEWSIILSGNYPQGAYVYATTRNGMIRNTNGQLVIGTGVLASRPGVYEIGAPAAPTPVSKLFKITLYPGQSLTHKSYRDAAWKHQLKVHKNGHIIAVYSNNTTQTLSNNTAASGLSNLKICLNENAVGLG